ncbi:Uma2 family endonuclease [Streptomyces sp. NRRL WC-3742]|uniref:Uma2 family endonuclease n=1 Tax=Streptomyces sp. NRRL WC-3742 TaxID=1463934 RepID=UPI00099BE9B3|nr:Uma2 family endonuclease [Streptomyces sp. NRRL WC-3742]
MSIDPAVFARLREIADQLPQVPGVGSIEIANGQIVFPEATPEGEQPAVLPHEVLLVVEIVSKSNPENEYEYKVHDYSAMGIPFYLLVDPRTGTGTVYSEPRDESQEKFTFGDTVAVGPWSIDTSGLLTYA